MTTAAETARFLAERRQAMHIQFSAARPEPAVDCCLSSTRSLSLHAWRLDTPKRPRVQTVCKPLANMQHLLESASLLPLSTHSHSLKLPARHMILTILLQIVLAACRIPTALPCALGHGGQNQGQ